MKHISYPGRDLTENKGVNPNEILTCSSVSLREDSKKNKTVLCFFFVRTAVTQSQVYGSSSLCSLLLTACLTLALLHHHHSPLLDLGPAAQGHSHRVSFGWGAAWAGGPVDPRKLPFRWDEQGAALAETQLVVHCYRVASVCCHTLLGWKRGRTGFSNIVLILPPRV